MKKAREIARELALLGISQLPANPELLEAKKTARCRPRRHPHPDY
jgi:hypothetical protein